MSYISIPDFVTLAGETLAVELTNLDDPAANTINTTKLQKALDFASSEIDGYLATRYLVPLPATPLVIQLFCSDITKYRLAENNPPEGFKTKYDSAIARLRDVERGILLLVDEAGVALPPRNPANTLVDERGNPLDDYSADYIPGGRRRFTEKTLALYGSVLRY